MVTAHLKGCIKKGSLSKVKCSMNDLLRTVMAEAGVSPALFFSSTKFTMAMLNVIVTLITQLVGQMDSK